MVADGAGPVQQRDQDDDRGNGGGVRGHPVPTHEQLRRGAWTAHRHQRQDRQEHPDHTAGSCVVLKWLVTGFGRIRLSQFFFFFFEKS